MYGALNIWVSFVVLFVIVALFSVFMYVRIKNTFDRLAKVMPELDVCTQIFGKTVGRIMPFIIYALVGY